MSGRARFYANRSRQFPIASHAKFGSNAQAEAAGASGPSGFLPPTVTFQTLNSGGWMGTGPWFQVGSAKYPANGTNCSAAYLLLVFDRQSLQPVSGVPSGCVGTGTELVADFTTLKTQAPGALVVVGTTFGQIAEKTLDTTLIGGTNFTNADALPRMYVAIGVAGAAPGTAYENYNLQVDRGDSRWTPMFDFAGGVVQEAQNDVHGFTLRSSRGYPWEYAQKWQTAVICAFPGRGGEACRGCHRMLPPLPLLPWDATQPALAPSPSPKAAWPDAGTRLFLSVDLAAHDF